jgi:hypothetical protein
LREEEQRNVREEYRVQYFSCYPLNRMFCYLTVCSAAFRQWAGPTVLTLVIGLHVAGPCTGSSQVSNDEGNRAHLINT